MSNGQKTRMKGLNGAKIKIREEGGCRETQEGTD